ncbi:MAG: hypothetical protein ACRD3M_10425 [Thermoanaerobaculia bacterium]
MATLLVPFVVLTAGGRYLGSGDSVPAELLPISVLGDGDLAFDEFVQSGHPLPYWGQRVNGRVLSNYPILPGVLNVPVYAAARVCGVSLYAERFSLSLLTCALLVSFSVVFLHRCLLALGGSESEAALFAFAYFFGTAVWSVAGKGLFQHGPSVFFLALALLLLAKDRPRWTALAGFGLAMAVVNRPTNALVALPLTVFAIRYRQRGFLGYVALAAIPAALHALYTWSYFGTPFSSTQPVTIGQFSGTWTEGLAGLLLSPSRGLFVFSPFLLFCIPASVMAFRKGEPRLYRYLTVAVVLELALYSRWDNWWGGHTFGYRLLIELVPLLVLILARHWRRFAAFRGSMPVFGALLALSVAVQALGAWVFPSGFNTNIDREPWRLWTLADSEIVLDVQKLTGKGKPSGLSEFAPNVPSAAPPKPVWWSADADDESIPGHLDWPREGAFVRRELVVRGWAGSGEGPVDVQVLLGSGEPALSASRHNRLDVCGVFPELGDCRRIGFGVTIPSKGGRLRESLVSVELRDSRGHVRRLGPVRFYWRG